MPPAYLKAAPVPLTPRVDHWCDGKEQFASAVLAHAVVARTPDKVRVVVYCRTCGSYHVCTDHMRRQTSKAAQAELIRKAR